MLNKKECESSIKKHITEKGYDVCKKEYPLINVKLKTWKSNPIRISKSMIKDAEKEWNKMQLN